MSVARACRRFRRKIKHDKRYNGPTLRDRAARERRDALKAQAERERKMRGAK